MIINLIFFLGPTNVGKTTLIDYSIKEFGAAGIFVGRVLRAKHGEDFFQGQAAPDCTKVESLQIMDDEIQEAIKNNKELILIDGQPRSDDQLQHILKKYIVTKTNHNVIPGFLLLHCSNEIRRERMLKRDLTPEKKKLAEQRFFGDLPQVHKVVYDLILLGYKDIIYPLNSENSFVEFKHFYRILLERQKGF